MVLDRVPHKPPCDSPIWGSGSLLDTIQRAKLFKDSKTFVDLKLKHPESTVCANFRKLQNPPTREDLSNFVKENFSLEQGQELENWNPTDWRESPKYLGKVTDGMLLHLGREVNKLWKELSRKCSDDLRENPDFYSKLYLPNGFVMPGGRFREIYYWDTYWIVRGLLLSEMYETVKGILVNFVSQIGTFGFIPNGTR